MNRTHSNKGKHKDSADSSTVPLCIISQAYSKSYVARAFTVRFEDLFKLGNIVT